MPLNDYHISILLNLSKSIGKLFSCFFVLNLKITLKWVRFIIILKAVSFWSIFSYTNVRVLHKRITNVFSSRNFIFYRNTCSYYRKNRKINLNIYSNTFLRYLSKKMNLLRRRPHVMYEFARSGRANL